MNEGEIYSTGGFLTGIVVFIGVWIYAISEWGFLVGLAIGWLPAIIAAVILGFLWPLIALGIVWMLITGRGSL